jgi:hypothetical protein
VLGFHEGFADLVATFQHFSYREVVQPAGTFDFFGGATVIIGPKGEVRYVIARNILNKKRLDEPGFHMRRRPALWRDGFIDPVRNAFKLLHKPATSTAAFSG